MKKLHLKKLDLSGRKAKKTAAKTAVTLTASAGLLLGGLFSSPVDLMQDPSRHPENFFPNTAVEMTLDEPPADDIAPDEDDGGCVEDEEKRRGWKAALRSRILRLPLAVRACVCLPLWAVGWLLLSALTALWGGVLSPLLGDVLTWVAIAAIVLACLLGVVKTAFPDVPVKKILNRRTVLLVLAGVVLCAGLDVLLPDVWEGYETVRAWFRFAGSTALLAGAAVPFFRKKKA